MAKAIARAVRRRETLKNSTHATIAEIATAERINESSVLRMTLLAPDIVGAILGGRQSADITLAVLMGPLVLGLSNGRRNSVGKKYLR
jgi:hypothetical protein